MAFYGIGQKSIKQEDGGFSTTSVLIAFDDNIERSRIETVKGIEHLVRKDRIKLDGIYPMANNRKNDGVMTKGIRAQKIAAHAKQVHAHKMSVTGLKAKK
jgi:hypothetical protein